MKIKLSLNKIFYFFNFKHKINNFKYNINYYLQFEKCLERALLYLIIR